MLQRDTTAEELRISMVRDAELRELNKELEAFSYSVSHDLRAPLRVVDGFSQILTEDYAKALDEAGRHYLDRIRNAAQHMGHLIDDMLKLSRIARADLTPAPIDVSAVASSIVDGMKADEAAGKANFVIARNMTLLGDINLLRIAFDNLIRNPVKFSAGRSPARIEIGQTQHNGNTVTYVRDNGVGFDMAFAGKLFGAFQRLHNAKEFQGTGVGLATVQRVINRHSGRVWEIGRAHV